MSSYHYSYVYADKYFYGAEIIELIDLVHREREDLRPQKLLVTSFAQDLKNKVLGIERPLRVRSAEAYQKKCGTWFNKDGTVMSAEDVGRL